MSEQQLPVPSRDEARNLRAMRQVIALALPRVERLAGLWPRTSDDSCDPARDLRDALAHIDQALSRIPPSEHSGGAR